VSRAQASARCAALLIAIVTGSAPGARAEPNLVPVYRINVDGPISPAIDDFVSSAIERAHEHRAAALVITLDTPGGLLNSTKSIVKSFLAAPLPILVYVSPGGAGATSAGVFITMAAHVAAMAPGTTIGAAHPVSGGGETIEGDMRQKVENFAVSFVESIAQRRGRNVEWAEKAVRESVSITETEAVSNKVVDFVARDLDDLVRQADGHEVEIGGSKRKLDFSRSMKADGQPYIIEMSMTLRQRVLRLVTDPNIAYLLMMAGLLGLYFEFSNPGTVFPGVAGAICLLLALLAGQVLPINSTGVLLVLVGMGFLIAELFLPSFGVLGVGGIIALTLGSLFLYTPESELQVDPSLIITTVVIFSSVVLTILVVLWKDRRAPSRTGAEGMVGAIGVAVTAVHESGTVKVQGELWNATSREPIAANKRVRVKALRGLTLDVSEETQWKT
jgi:membrane-bound serine protease (ClpP class)